MWDPAAGLGIQTEDKGHDSSGGMEPGTSCTHVTRWGFFLQGPEVMNRSHHGLATSHPCKH